MKPRLTSRVIDGIIAGLCPIESGGGEGDVIGKDYDDAMAALAWARAMREYRNAIAEARRDA